MSDKQRPVQERIAAMQGRGAGQGFGGLPTLTDQDIAAALGMIRHRRELLGDAPEIAAELLETYYGSTDRHRPTLRAAYLRANPPADKAERTVRRLAATLAVQMVAGVGYSRSQLQEFAFICGVRTDTMTEEVKAAFGWLHAEAEAAASAFREVVGAAKLSRRRRSLGAVARV